MYLHAQILRIIRGRPFLRFSNLHNAISDWPTHPSLNLQICEKKKFKENLELSGSTYYFSPCNLHSRHFSTHPPTLICILCKLKKMYAKMDHPLQKYQDQQRLEGKSDWLRNDWEYDNDQPRRSQNFSLFDSAVNTNGEWQIEWCTTASCN